MGTSKLIDSSAAFLFEVPGSNTPLAVQELQIGGTRSGLANHTLKTTTGPAKPEPVSRDGSLRPSVSIARRFPRSCGLNASRSGSVGRNRTARAGRAGLRHAAGRANPQAPRSG